MTRRSVLLGLFALPLLSDDAPADPWQPDDLIQPEELAAQLKSNRNMPHVVSVAFPVLYRQKHIPDAPLAGPGSKPEGIEDLKKAVAQFSKDSEIVIYCGCCPMVKCPNIRPAYRTLKELGFTKIRVLNLPTNFHTDWVAKGYPVQS